MTVDQFVERDDGPFEQQKRDSRVCRRNRIETALIRVYNDISIALDQKRSVILLLPDLSAAFDTVDHSILLSRLSRRFGIQGKALGVLIVFELSHSIC